MVIMANVVDKESRVVKGKRRRGVVGSVGIVP